MTEWFEKLAKRAIVQKRYFIIAHLPHNNVTALCFLPRVQPHFFLVETQR